MFPSSVAVHPVSFQVKETGPFEVPLLEIPEGFTVGGVLSMVKV